MTPKRPRNRKPLQRLRSSYLQVRITGDEKQLYERAADQAGIDVSSWVRERLRSVANSELAPHSRRESAS